MNCFFRPAIVVFAAALTGCALQGSNHAQSLAAQRKAQDEAVAAQVLTQPLSLDTALNLGSSALLMVDIPAKGAYPATLARLFARCAALTLGMDYRRGEDWSRTFALPDAHPATGTIAVQLCQAAKGGRWRVLAGGGDDWLLVDPDTLSEPGPRRLIWAGIDYQRTHRSEDESYAYDRQFERVEIDCSDRHINTRLALRVNGISLRKPPVQPLASALDKNQQARLMDAVCAKPAALGQLPVMDIREKLPPNLVTPQVPNTLLELANALPQGKPTHTLSFLQFAYNATSPLIPSAKVNGSRLDLHLQKGPATGLWRIQEVGALAGNRVSIRWRGLIDLAVSSEASDGKMSQQDNLVGITLEGDWKNLPAGSVISYNKVLSSSGKRETSTFKCSVGESFPAAEKLASLQGPARKVSCEHQGAFKNTNEYLFLQDYDLFVETAERSPLIIQINTLKVAE